MDTNDVVTAKVAFRKSRSEMTPEELRARRAYDAQKARESRARRSAKVEVQAVGVWTRPRAFQYLRQQGFGIYPETEWVLQSVWEKYCELRRTFVDSQLPRFFDFRDADGLVNDSCTVLWPAEIFDCIFGEIAAGVLAPNTQTELHVVRELAKALGHRDVQEGDTYRSFFSSVWAAWASKGFPMFSRTAYPTKLTPGTPPERWTGDIASVGYVFDVDSDKPIDVSTLKPFSPLIAELHGDPKHGER